jgi:hypothetical protein
LEWLQILKNISNGETLAIFPSELRFCASPECLYVFGYLILEKIESKKVIFKNLLMCQTHFSPFVSLLLTVNEMQP